MPRGPWRAPALVRTSRSLALAALAILGALPAAAAAETTAPAFTGNVVNADNWAAQPPGKERDRILSRWAAGASLPELVYVLRRSRDELGPVETEIVERALDRAPASRAALRRRLLARLAAADASRTKRRAAAMAEALREPPFAPGASVFRAALLAPARGAYEDFARALRAGFEAGLARGADDEYPIETRAWDTGDHDPARAAAAIDSAVRASAVLVGELLSAPTIAAATAARVAGTPLVSPTATDESIGGIGPAVFAIGPSSWDRGARLAAAHALRGARVGVLVSNASAPAFARGFVAAAQKAGASIAWEATYSAGNTAFRGESKAIGDKKLDVLFWDGEPREADALLRQLAKDRVAVRVCGGGALAPELVHADARFLLEGVHYVADEWALPDAEQAWLDAWARERTSEAAGPLHVRGFLAGRLVRDAVRSGALCPEEIAAWLDRRRHGEPHLREHGFVDFGVPGTTLPIHVVRRGKATRVASP